MTSRKNEKGENEIEELVKSVSKEFLERIVSVLNQEGFLRATGALDFWIGRSVLPALHK